MSAGTTAGEPRGSRAVASLAPAPSLPLAPAAPPRVSSVLQMKSLYPFPTGSIHTFGSAETGVQCLPLVLWCWVQQLVRASGCATPRVDAVCAPAVSLSEAFAMRRLSLRCFLCFCRHRDLSFVCRLVTRISAFCLDNIFSATAHCVFP